MSGEGDRRLDKTIRWSGILVAVIVVSFCGKPFVNHLLYQRECTALLSEARRLEGLSREQAVEKLKRSKLFHAYSYHVGAESILLISKNESGFILYTSIPAAKLTIVQGKVSQAKLIVRGSYF